jgi:uncharacterized protein
MFLIDTNIWLELLLEQENADHVRAFFQRTDASLLAISEFSLYSIGIILIRLKKSQLFLDFLNDIIEESGMTILRLGVGDLKGVVAATKKFSLDFDDAYQYVAGFNYNHILISFDADFDVTDRGRKTPLEALKLNLNNSST